MIIILITTAKARIEHWNEENARKSLTQSFLVFYIFNQIFQPYIIYCVVLKIDKKQDIYTKNVGTNISIIMVVVLLNDAVPLVFSNILFRRYFHISQRYLRLITIYGY